MELNTGEFGSIRDEWSSVRVEFSLTSDGCNSIRDESNAIRPAAAGKHCWILDQLHVSTVGY